MLRLCDLTLILTFVPFFLSLLTITLDSKSNFVILFGWIEGKSLCNCRCVLSSVGQ